MFLLTQIWGWITANAVVFSGLTSIGMLLIWGIYLQLILQGFRMQQRPKLLISRGHGRDVNSFCILSNMSQQPIYIETIIAQLETSSGTYFTDLTDVVDEHGEYSELPSDAVNNDHPLSRLTRQGPLNPGQYMTGGTFGAMIRQIATEDGLQLDADGQDISGHGLGLLAIEIRVVALFGVRPYPIGALRRFTIRRLDNGQLHLEPVSPDTRQLGARRYRRRLRRWREAVA